MSACVSVCCRIRRIIGHGLALAALMLLAGCSTLQLAYEQSETLVYWWADRYADFSAEQKPQVRAALAELKRWHRQHQLPVYLDLLQRAQRLALRDDVRGDEICQLARDAQASYRALLRQFEPTATALLVQLTPAQRQHIRQRYADGDAEWRAEWLRGDAEQQLRHRVTQARERLEKLYGRLDTAQRTLLRDWLANAGFDPTLSLALRDQRQTDSLQTFERMAQVGAGPAAEALLHDWLDRAFDPVDPRLHDYSHALWQTQCAGFARLHDSATPTQRRHLLATLQGYEHDVRAQLP